MSELAMWFGIGCIIGIILFFILAFTGYIDKWSEYIERWMDRRTK